MIWPMLMGCYSAALEDVENGRAFLYNASDQDFDVEIEGLEGAGCAFPIEYADLREATPLPLEQVTLRPGESHGLWQVHDDQRCIAANLRVGGLHQRVLFAPDDPREVRRIRKLGLFAEQTVYIAPDKEPVFTGPRYPDPQVCEVDPELPTFEVQPGAGLVTSRFEHADCVSWTLDDGSAGEVCGSAVPQVPGEVGESLTVSLGPTSVHIESADLTWVLGLSPADVPDWLYARPPSALTGDACRMSCEGSHRMRLGFSIENQSGRPLAPVRVPQLGALEFFVSPAHEAVDVVVYDATFGGVGCEERLVFAALRR